MIMFLSQKFFKSDAEATEITRILTYRIMVLTLTKAFLAPFIFSTIHIHFYSLLSLAPGVGSLGTASAEPTTRYVAVPTTGSNRR